MNANRHANRHLQFAWNKYGDTNFLFEIIEECAIDELNERECYWIKYYNAYKEGYNLDTGGQGVKGFKHTEAEISKMRKIQNPLVVLQFDLSFNFMGRFEGGVSHVSKVLKYTKVSILSRCNHKSKLIPYKNSYWVYEDEYLSEKFSWKNYLNNISYYTPPKKSKKRIQKKICQYDLNRNLIKIWGSYSELEQAGYNRVQINTICNQRKNKKTHMGYIWAYEGYDFSNGYFDNLNSNYNKATEERKKKVKQFDKQGNFIRIFNSIKEASIAVGTRQQNISRALAKNQCSAGFKWEYV